MQAPIPAPGPPEILKDEPRAFSYSFSQFFVRTFLLGGLFGIISILSDPEERKPGAFSIEAVIFGFACGAIVGLILTAICVQVFKVILSKEGVRGHSVGGIPVTLAWDEITAANPINLVSFRYVRLSTTSKKNVTWFPLFLKDLAQARDAVSIFAPPQNPLRQYLESNVK